MDHPTAPADRPSATTDRRPPNLTRAAVDDLVVFHIGMTVRTPWRPDLWGPVFAAMPRMLSELHHNRAAAARGDAEDRGFLGADTLMGAKGPWVMQYWRSTEQLYAYAPLSARGRTARERLGSR